MASATPSNTAQISLPPGLTLDQFMTLQGQIVTIAITHSVVFGVILWDYFSQLPDEIALYLTKDKKIWSTPATWFFVILRYAGLLATLPSLSFTAIQSQHCQAAASSSQVGAILVVASSGAIFSFRVFAIWNGVKIVQAAVSLMYLVMLGCWIANATQFSAIVGPPTPFGSNCLKHPIKSWAPISYGSSLAFDTLVLVLTLAKLHGNLATQSRVGRQIYQDNLMYFLLTTVSNTVVLTIEALGPKFDMVKPAVLPFSTLMTVTMGARVFLNLKLFDQRQRNAAAGIPLVMSSHSSGPHQSSNQPNAGEVKNPYDDRGYAKYAT